MINGFGALVHRMNYIGRWGLMRNARPESLAEHAMCTAYVAHILACIARSRYGARVDPERTACFALYHDASEIITGDLPTPVKYANEGMRDEYKKLEKTARRRLISMLPDDIAEAIKPSVTGEKLSERELRIVKAADKLCALIKCIEEEAAGNSEFASAKSSILKTLNADALPETACFLGEFIPAYSMTLDELMAL
jgi:5'-deoxynucleotidase